MKNIYSGKSIAYSFAHYHNKKIKIYKRIKWTITLTMISMFTLISSISFGQQGDDLTNFYYHNGERVYLDLDTRYIHVSGESASSIEDTDFSALVNSQKVSDILQDNTREKLEKPINFQGDTSPRFNSKIELSGGLSQDDYLLKIDDIRRSTELLVAPSFKFQNEKEVGLSNYFYVKLKDESDFDAMMEMLAENQVDLIGYNRYMPLWFTISTTEESANAMVMANIFHESRLFDYAQPSFIVNMLQEAPVSADQFFPDQWGMLNTGQYGGWAGIDINAETAWGIEKGNSSIIVSVIDEGIDLSHPDLAANILGSHNAVTGTSPSTIYGPHGNACAGIVAAIDDNGIGITGVAPNAGLYSVSITFGSANLYQDLADAMNWSWINGSSVISNSWGGGPPNTLVNNAITAALANGRGGLGSVVVFATGNDNNLYGGVSWPANSDPDILAVGAMSPCGERKNPSSCDGEGWGSNYGNELDIIAPGVFISTTDIQGDIAGCGDYSPAPPECGITPNTYTNNNYTSSFNGTSSATPAAAGVAALMLSINPSLTVLEVNNLIEQTGQKVRTDLYGYSNVAGRPNGTWNNQVGYGLIDASAAVLAAENFGGAGGCSVENWFIPHLNFPGLYAAEIRVIASVNINPNFDFVAFTAEDYILLEPGFETKPNTGNYFVGKIEECTSFGPGEDEEDAIAYAFDDPTYIIYDDYTSHTESREKEIIQASTQSDSKFSVRNYPNPFNTKTQIELILKESQQVSLIISDMNGKKISSLQEPRVLDAGKHEFSFNAQNLRAGVYYYTLIVGEELKTGKLFLTN